MTRVRTGIVAATVLLAAVALVLDGIGWGSRFVDPSLPVVGTVGLRVLRTLVAAALPFTEPSAWRIRAALLGCGVADIVLVGLHWPIGGIAVFALVQALLLTRGIELAGPLWRTSDRKPAVLATASALALILCIVLATFGDRLLAKGLLLPIAGYCVLLGSMVTAALAGVLLSPPTRTTGLFAVGALAFVGCDVTVGIGAIFGATAWGAAVQAATGVPWTLALVCLALSGFGDRTEAGEIR